MTTVIRARLPRARNCGSVARRLLAEGLTSEVDEQTLQDAKVVASELVNNAFLHGQGAIELRVQLLDDRVRIEVIDEGEGVALAVPQAGDDGAHGLQIVDMFSASWGAYEGTTHVWSELDITHDD